MWNLGSWMGIPRTSDPVFAEDFFNDYDDQAIRIACKVELQVNFISKDIEWIACVVHPVDEVCTVLQG